MNDLYKFLCLFMVFLLLQSCVKEHRDQDEVIIEFFTFGARINWIEDSIKTDNGKWNKIEKGHVFTWLADDSVLNNALKKPYGFATYDDRSNLMIDFLYTIKEDEIFQFRLSSDSIYFLDKNDVYRTDINGRISLVPHTSLILQNTAVTPDISIKYRLEK